MTSSSTSSSISISAVTFDCLDALAVATFWSRLLGSPVDEGGTPEFASIGSGAVTLAFVAVPEQKTSKNRLHLDLRVSELRPAVDAALALGATLVGDFDGWTVLRDPFGNELCLVG